MGIDVRVDIIYFNMAADWSFEAALYGENYDLRLLSQHASTKRDAIKALGKAVSRSETVIMLGGFYGEEYLPTAVASAVGVKCQRVGLAGNSPEEAVLLPVAASPFALNGRIRGAVMKRGPQTIVLLDEERSGRTEITRDKIVPVFFDADSYKSDPEHSPNSENISKKDEANTKAGRDAVKDGFDKITQTDGESDTQSRMPEEIETEKVVLKKRARDDAVLPEIPLLDEPTAEDSAILTELPSIKFKETIPAVIPRPEPDDDMDEDAPPETEKFSGLGFSKLFEGERKKTPAMPPDEIPMAKADKPASKGTPAMPPDEIPMAKADKPVLPEDLEIPEDDLPVKLPAFIKIAIAAVLFALIAAALWFGYNYFSSDDNLPQGQQGSAIYGAQI